MSPGALARWIAGAVLILVLVLAASSGTYTVQPGYRGVEVTLGRVSPAFKPEGFGFKLPFVTNIIPTSIRQRTAKFQADCYSADLQQIQMAVQVLYRVPQSSVVELFRDYAGDPFTSLVEPRVAEGLKEVTAQRTAEVIVQKREDVKSQTLDATRRKLGEFIVIEDIVIEDISLTGELESAIEQKMVQEQEAAKARFKQQQAQIEASTLVIRAKGEAESISLRGKALRENPGFIDLQIVERWDGITPLVVGPHADGAKMILPIGDLGTVAAQPEASR
jgi:prohibitin 2